MVEFSVPWEFSVHHGSTPKPLKVAAIMKQIVLMLLTSTILTGCLVVVRGHLYPVQGALFAQTPVPIYQVTIL
jgi:hypothetical protein